MSRLYGGFFYIYHVYKNLITCLVLLKHITSCLLVQAKSAAN